MERIGASTCVAKELGEVCTAAGLEELAQRAHFALSGPRNVPSALSMEIQTLRGYENAMVQSGVPSADQLRGHVDELEAAKSWNFEYSWGALFNELLARVPDGQAVG